MPPSNEEITEVDLEQQLDSCEPDGKVQNEEQLKSTCENAVAKQALPKDTNTEQLQLAADKKMPIKIPAKQGSDKNLNVSENSNHLELPFGGERKGSVVSFSETCDLYEIDLETVQHQKRQASSKSKPSCFLSIRYYVIILALLSPFVTTYSKTIINFAITDMIDPEYLETQKANSSSAHSTARNSSLPVTYFDLDNSCPVDDLVRARLIEENEKDNKRAHSGIGEKFKWDSFDQGLLKSAYSFGHAPFQIPGSRMSERYGSHRVMTISSMIIAACCLFAPYLAVTHFYLLFLDLFILGVLGSFMTPALITLFSNWLSPSEKTIALTFYLIASRLGYALSPYLCGKLIHADLSWKYVFFSASLISFIFSTMFLICARSRPQDHPLISQLELDYLASKNILVREDLAVAKKKGLKDGQEIEERELKVVTTITGNGSQVSSQESLANSSESSRKQANKNSKTKKKIPWFAILTNHSVWAFIITKFCVKLAGDTVQIQLPAYLKQVMHYDADENGLVNASMYVMFCAGCFIVGALAKSITRRRPYGLSKTAIRKIFQSIGSFGVAAVLIGIAFSACDYWSTQIFLMLMFFITTFGTGGEAQIPLDITERYPGTIHAIGSSLAISGAIGPLFVGYYLNGHDSDLERWKVVWFISGAISAFGGMVFLILADAKIQKFDSLNGSEDDLNQEDGEEKVDKKSEIQKEGGTGAKGEKKLLNTGLNNIAIPETDVQVGQQHQETKGDESEPVHNESTRI